MKKMSRILCLTGFLLLCLLTISFLQQFTRVDETMSFIDWESAVHIGEDGQEEPFDPNTAIGSEPTTGGSYRFTASIPSDLPAGYLLFETSGMKITMTLDGKKIYSSNLKIPGDDYATSQAQITLAPGTTGSLIMTCTPSKEAASLFPPLIRFFPEKLREQENYAYTNLQSLPAGASAMAFLLVAGLFGLSLLYNRPDYSLIPLALAAALLMSYRLIQAQGYYFLPTKVLDVFYWPGWGLAIPLLLLLYLVMNCRRSFLIQLGRIALISGAVLAVCTLISYFRGSYLYRYLSDSLSALLTTGYYDGLLYWFTLWLTGVCAALSAYGIASDFARTQTEKQTLALKARLITANYHAMEDKIQQTADWRHEWQHQLHSMKVLLEKKDYEGMEQFLEQLHPEKILLSKTTFTGNVFVNTILQDFYSRATRQGISLTTHVLLPGRLSIPEADLCTLLMNMLENALEACEKLPETEDRRIHIKMRLRHGYLAISCENSYNGEIKTTKDGHLMTSKEDASLHGLGMRQMEMIAEKYDSVLFTEYDNKNTFLVQTALKLPKADEPERQF